MLRKLYLLSIAFLLLSTEAWPQASIGIVRGVVTDQTSAVVPGASVVLTSLATNVTARTVTNGIGFYIFPGVVPGRYRLTVESAGMQKFEGVLTAQVQQDVVVDATLRVGQAATEVSVQDVTPVVTSDSPTLGRVLEREWIEQLPLNGRYLTDLLQTVPGMEGNRAYGLREGSHEFTLDGAATSNRMWGDIRGRQPGLDTVQEFKVETNSSSAKYTRPTTVVISTKSGTNALHGAAFETARNNAIGKARQRTDFYDKPPQLVRNEFGASSGGPVFIPKLYNGKNRTFWFFAYEALRNINPTTMGFQVPTVAMRNGDFRGLVDSQGRQTNIYDPWTTNAQTWERLPFSYQGKANVIDPARLSPLAKYLYSITPLPTMPEVNPLLDNNWWGPQPKTGKEWTVNARIDHRFSDKDQFYGRFTQGAWLDFRERTGQVMLNNVAGTVNQLAWNKSIALSWVRTVSPTFFNELLVSVNRARDWRGTGEPGVVYSAQLGLPTPFNAAGWPGLTSTGLSSYTFYTDNIIASGLTYGIVDDHATKIRGKHQLQFGIHFRYDQLNVLPDQQSNQGSHNFSTLATALYDPKSSRSNPLATALTGHNLANMYIGVMNYQNIFNRSWFYSSAKEYALYFQDNYRVTSRLTLNLGLRWEAWPPFHEKYNSIATFDPAQHAVVLATDLDSMYRLGASLPSIVNRLQSLGAKFISYKEAGMPRSLMNGTWSDVGPRLGFAYRLGTGARPAVLRGGYRISYFPIPLRPWEAEMQFTAPQSARFYNDVTAASYSPDGTANRGLRGPPNVIAGVNSQNAVQVNDAQSLGRGSATVYYFSPDQPDPRVQDWNMTLEKELLPNVLGRAAYVGNHGQGLEVYRKINDQTPDYIWYTTTRKTLPSGEYSSVARRPYDQQVYGEIMEYTKRGFSNFNGIQLELQRRYSKGWGFQLFYVTSNALSAGGLGYTGTVLDTNQFMPGAVPTDFDQRNRFLNYQRDTGIPKHRVRWNWIADLPFGKGKPLGRNAGGALDRFIGGWQVAGMGNLKSTYFTLPTNIYPTGEKIEIYGYKYPIQDCRSGACSPGYLWFNGYIPANQINSVDSKGNPNGVMGVPSNYKPAAQPLIPWPKTPDRNDPNYAYFGTNTVWVPLSNGTLQRTVFNDGLHPWRNQFLPSVRQWGLNASLFKRIPIDDKRNLRFTADFFNVLNHPGNPSSVTGDGILSTRSSGTSSRELQLTLRLVW